MAAEREIGGLTRPEMWWRDRYYALESYGYKLRPRYHPNWVPSWKESGKEYYAVEDGQPSVVSIVRLTFSIPHLSLDTYSDGRNARGWNAGDVKEGLCERRATGIEVRPNVLFTRSQGRSQPLRTIAGNPRTPCHP